MHQGCIATYPQNDIFNLLIENMLIQSDKPIGILPAKKYQLIMSDIACPGMTIGFNKGNEDTNYILFLEENRRYDGEKVADMVDIGKYLTVITDC